MPPAALTLIGIDAAELPYHPVASAQAVEILASPRQRRCAALGGTGRHLAGRGLAYFCPRAEPGEHGIYKYLQWDPLPLRIRGIHPQLAAVGKF